MYCCFQLIYYSGSAGIGAKIIIIIIIIIIISIQESYFENQGINENNWDTNLGTPSLPEEEREGGGLVPGIVSIVY